MRVRLPTRSCRLSLKQLAYKKHKVRILTLHPHPQCSGQENFWVKDLTDQEAQQLLVAASPVKKTLMLQSTTFLLVAVERS